MMGKFFMNFMMSTTFFAVIFGAIAAAIWGLVHFWLMVSGGAMWALAGLLVSVVSIVCGIGFAASEASK